MNIPTKQECYGFIRELGMMDHIVDHSEQVCRVAVCLADNLRRGGAHLNIDLIRAAALLHDITKTRSFTTQENHAETGGMFLQKRGYREVGRIVAQHVKLDTYTAANGLVEAEIVNYADKRVLHDQIVSLADRMAYILEKYADSIESRERIMGLWTKSKTIEKRIFSQLSFEPDVLKQTVDAHSPG
jgi:uncharacterized protein